MPCRRDGFTLAEMLVTCAVLAVAAAVALPTSQPAVEVRAGAAASEVARALRFAREDAMRTGVTRMVKCDMANNTLTVYVPDTSGNVATALNDPLTKMNYALALGQPRAGVSATLRTCSFQFSDNTQAAAVAFDPSGNPVRGIATTSAPAPARPRPRRPPRLARPTSRRSTAVPSS
ncbi:Tfp pilus assembly protein FimT/FimU [Massilia sp. 9096]|uniref:pilus assembly FimT family protein n=1 Tax=Massilia sp. 9096 TaxID=1500894 RepID=UPI000565BB9C|nr:GspH/FimT family pseudopilin [Massilia sp. 9096]